VAVLAGRLDVAAGVQRPNPTVSAAGACLPYFGEAMPTADGSQFTRTGCTARRGSEVTRDQRAGIHLCCAWLEELIAWSSFDAWLALTSSVILEFRRSVATS